MEKIYKRAVRAALHRKKGKSTQEVWVRYFANTVTAIRRGVELALLTGEPGDVLELSSSNYGYAIATIGLTVGATSLCQLKIELAEGMFDLTREQAKPLGIQAAPSKSKSGAKNAKNSKLH